MTSKQSPSNESSSSGKGGSSNTAGDASEAPLTRLALHLRRKNFKRIWSQGVTAALVLEEKRSDLLSASKGSPQSKTETRSTSSHQHVALSPYERPKRRKYEEANGKKAEPSTPVTPPAVVAPSAPSPTTKPAAVVKGEAKIIKDSPPARDEEEAISTEGDLDSDEDDDDLDEDDLDDSDLDDEDEEGDLDEDDDDDDDVELDSGLGGRKRACTSCGATKTPMWRRGPTGKGTLCNACGVRWSLTKNKKPGKLSSREGKLSSEARKLAKEERRRKHFEKAANAIVQNLSKEKRLRKPGSQSQSDVDPSDDDLNGVGYGLRNRNRIQHRRRSQETSVLGKRRSSRRTSRSESEESEGDEEFLEDELETEESAAENDEIVPKKRLHTAESPGSKQPNHYKKRPLRNHRANGRRSEPSKDETTTGSSNRVSEEALEDVRKELQSIREALEAKEKAGDTFFSQLRLEVLSQLQGARIEAEGRLGELRIEMENDVTSKKTESLRLISSMGNQLDLIRSLFEADRTKLQRLLAPETNAAVLAQMDRILSTIDTRCARRVENLKSIWEKVDGRMADEVQKGVMENLHTTEKELCNDLDKNQETLQTEFADIRNRLTLLEQCLQHNLLDVTKKEANRNSHHSAVAASPPPSNGPTTTTTTTSSVSLPSTSSSEATALAEGVATVAAVAPSNSPTQTQTQTPTLPSTSTSTPLQNGTPPTTNVPESSVVTTDASVSPPQAQPQPTLPSPISASLLAGFTPPQTPSSTHHSSPPTSSPSLLVSNTVVATAHAN